VLEHHTPIGQLIVFLTGVVASIFGSLAGLGGGFLVVPVLRLFFEIVPAVAAGNALLFVLANTTAASFAFMRRRAVDVERGLIIAAAGIPTSVVGAYVVHLFQPREFDALYGAFLVALAIMVITRRDTKPEPRELSPRAKLAVEIGSGILLGFFSSFFGIGGGIVVVPVLLIYLNLPVHTVAATSAFVVMLTSPAGVIAHGFYGDLELFVAVPLILGGLVGGSIGARLAGRFSAKGLSMLLATMLILAALGLVVKHFA
jgi:uncharacterized protein